MMLARAARRKLRRDAFRSPTQLEQLTLPRLCPTQIRWAASVGGVTPDARRPRHGAPSPRHETRSLATQADVQPAQMGSVAFDGLIQPWSSRDSYALHTARLEPWNPAAPLILRDPTEPPTSITKFGIGGDPIELYQNLHACLRVGRMDRATAIIQRLTTMYSPTASEVVEAHNAYLQTMFELAQQNPDVYSMDTIEEWYDTHMVRKAIEPNAGTFIALLRASMALLEGAARDRSLRRYLALAEQCCGPDVLDQINDSEDFDDQEWDTLVRAQPGRFKEPPALEQPADTAHQYDISTPLGAQTLMDHGLIANPSHAIKVVPQKGESLNALKNALAVFDRSGRVPYPHEMEGTPEERDRAFAYMRQLQIERDATEAAANRWKIEDEKLAKLGIHGVVKSKPIQALMWQWYQALLPRLKKELVRTREVLSAPSQANSSDDRHVYGPYLESCKPEKLTALTISRITQEIVVSDRHETNDLRITSLTHKIAEDIRTEANAEDKRNALAQWKKERKQARRAMLDALAIQPATPKPEKPDTPTPAFPVDSSWKKDFPAAVKTRLGALMIELFLQSATVTVTAEDPKTGKTLSHTQAAFQHHIGYSHGKKTGWIHVHPEIRNKLMKESTHSVQTAQLPMVFEPKPWTGYSDGGYYTGSEGVVRAKNQDRSQRAYAETAIANGDMQKVLTGLDVLSKMPWQINKDVFEVMAQAWNAGEGIGAMVREKHGLVHPGDLPPNASPPEKRKWMTALRTYENTVQALHSQRCYQNLQLETARAYVNEKKMYFPHSVDFRGRAYPIPPVLNHMGSDFSRGLLRFGNGKELGSVGLQWLKVHLANLYGFDKASLREREQFAMDNLRDVYDSAANPLTGRRWWTKAEDPWQCLACCIELRNALESPDPTRFISHLPVHQDGTCNGLQHYAALGGDLAGASQVNLEPSDRPQDIYTGVADLVRGMVEEDAAQGKKVAIQLKDKITRKVVKRTVMTNVYGVTFIGAKLQVEDELRGIYERLDETTELWHASAYVAAKIFDALGKIFNGAQEIQYWLGECGERITTSISPEQIKRLRESSEGKRMSYDPKYRAPKKGSKTAEKNLLKDMETFKTSIIWTTPLKMPVVQPYRKDTVQAIKTKLQDILIAKNSGIGAVNKRKQLQAFPPNFIHSLDATHMILSALKCNEMGLDFAAVHDSFWTHASDIPNLNVVLRDAFVRMHSEDIMGRLAAEFKARYAGSMYKAHLKRSSLVAKKIAAWRTAQRGGKPDHTAQRDAAFAELALEAKRQELLNSEDPKKKEEGLKMVTPTSIWLANQDPSAIASYRLALMGDSKNAAGRNFDDAKDKLLTAEAEQVTEKLEAAGKAPHDIADEDVEDAEMDMEQWEDEDDVLGTGEEKKAAKNYLRMNRLAVWLPITFPPVPKKGGWDVSRLRNSQYFFS